MQKTITLNNEKLIIYFKRKYDGEYLHLNPVLIRKQKLTPNKVKTIIKLHKKIDKLFLYMCDDPNAGLRKAGHYYSVLQFQLQTAWGFAKDAKYHKFWLLPKCTCPKMDNEDAYPTGYYTRNLACPIHGTV